MKTTPRKARIVAVLALIAMFYGLFNLLGIHCPIRFITGISCPGCGMTRALICLLRGDLTGAISFHPLVLVMIPAVIVILFRKRIPRRLFAGLTWTFILLLFAVYLYRMCCTDSEVVVFQPQEGAAYKTVHLLFQ